jgi:hypothetical protein
MWLRMIIWSNTVTKLNDDITYALQIVRILLEKSQRIVGANGGTQKQRQTGHRHLPCSRLTERTSLR